MKVTVFLKNDHEMVNSLFAKYKKASNRAQNGKKEIFEEIRREILIHSQMEVEIFYPALTSTTSTTAGQLVASAQEDHETIEKLLDEIARLGVQDRTFDSKMTRLIEEVTHHIEKEEDEIFNEARKILPEYRLEELGLEMEDRRKILTQLAA